MRPVLETQTYLSLRFTAEQGYREFLVPALLSEGYEVDVPMANLGIGEQLAWLAARL